MSKKEKGNSSLRSAQNRREPANGVNWTEKFASSFIIISNLNKGEQSSSSEQKRTSDGGSREGGPERREERDKFLLRAGPSLLAPVRAVDQEAHAACGLHVHPLNVFPLPYRLHSRELVRNLKQVVEDLLRAVLLGPPDPDREVRTAAQVDVRARDRFLDVLLPFGVASLSRVEGKRQKVRSQREGRSSKKGRFGLWDELTLRSTGTGCFFFLKKVFPRSLGRSGRILVSAKNRA